MFAAEDKSAKETSRRLHLSLSSVKQYRSSVIQKLSCTTMTGALKVAIERGLVEIISMTDKIQ